MMREQGIRQRLNESLLWLDVSEQQHNALLDAIVHGQPRITAPRNKLGHLADLRLTIVFAALVVFLGVAAAEGLSSMLFAWLQARPDAERLNTSIETNYTPVEYTLDDITFICSQAIADDRSFAVSFIVKGSNANLHALSDQSQREMTEQAQPSIYVDAEPYYQGKDSEITQVGLDDDGNLCLLYEGWHQGRPCTEMEVALTVLRAGQTHEETVSVPVIWMPTLENATLAEPIRIGDTGYTLSALTLHRTAWRTYLDYTFSVQDQPLAYAVKRPVAILCDADGYAVGRSWPYRQPLPDTLYIQVWDDAHLEKLYEQTLNVIDVTIPND